MLLHYQNYQPVVDNAHRRPSFWNNKNVSAVEIRNCEFIYLKSCFSDLQRRCWLVKRVFLWLLEHLKGRRVIHKIHLFKLERTIKATKIFSRSVRLLQSYALFPSSMTDNWFFFSSLDRSICCCNMYKFSALLRFCLSISRNTPSCKLVLYAKLKLISL